MGIEGGRKPYGRMKTAASIAAELVAPSIVSERLRMKRGSELSSERGIAGEATVLQAAGVGGGVVFDDPKIAIGGYAIGKAIELFDIGYQKYVLTQANKQKK